MQIIFDSEEEKEVIACVISNSSVCPSDIDLEDTCSDELDCCTCWLAALEAVEKKEG